MSKHLLPSRADFFEDFFNGEFRFPSVFNEQHGKLLGFPRIDVKEEGDKVIINANVPGIPAKDIDLDIEDNMLTISGHIAREAEEGKKDSDYYRMEREEGSFARTIALPATVDINAIDAKSKNGVLTIVLTKKNHEEKPKISIREE